MFSNLLERFTELTDSNRTPAAFNTGKGYKSEPAKGRDAQVRVQKSSKQEAPIALRMHHPPDTDVGQYACSPTNQGSSAEFQCPVMIKASLRWYE